MLSYLQWRTFQAEEGCSWSALMKVELFYRIMNYFTEFDDFLCSNSRKWLMKVNNNKLLIITFQSTSLPTQFPIFSCRTLRMCCSPDSSGLTISLSEGSFKSSDYDFVRRSQVSSSIQSGNSSLSLNTEHIFVTTLESVKALLKLMGSSITDSSVVIANKTQLHQMRHVPFFTKAIQLRWCRCRFSTPCPWRLSGWNGVEISRILDHSANQFWPVL